VTQGTANPTSYNVIKDESGFSADQIQTLTYKVSLVSLCLCSVRPEAP
jgi:hypothetical protein